MKKSILFLLPAFIFALASCGNQPAATPEKLLITGPTKISYVVGEAFSLEGITVNCQYSDKSQKVVSTYSTSPYQSGYTFTNSDIATSTTINVTASVDSKLVSGSFTISVSSNTPEPVREIINSTHLTATGNTYTDFTTTAFPTTGVVYKGNSARFTENSTNYIQLRNSNESGIYTSTSTYGYCYDITLGWNINKTTGSGHVERHVNIYASNTAFTGIASLSTADIKTTMACTSTKVDTNYTFTSEYKYIAIVPSDGAVYLSQITVGWIEVK